jgi:hypothetical protein
MKNFFKLMVCVTVTFTSCSQDQSILEPETIGYERQSNDSVIIEGKEYFPVTAESRMSGNASCNDPNSSSKIRDNGDGTFSIYKEHCCMGATPMYSWESISKSKAKSMCARWASLSDERVSENITTNSKD